MTKRSKHSLSHYRLLTCDMGELVPIGLMEVLPGDTIQHATSLLVRVSPLLSPVMHPVECKIHHWFVPHRLVWDNFEKFITGGPDGADATSWPKRIFTSGQIAVGSLGDYLGHPINTQTISSSILPFRGYSLIWNEWYRDQDLQTELVVSKGDSTDTTSNILLQKTSWEKDYFTSARPWAQKGPAVVVPLGTEAPVKSDGTQPSGRGAAGAMGALITTGSPNPNIQVTNTSAGAFDWGVDGTATTGLFADLTSATAVSVNDLRELFALQRFAEARARYGSRYTEYLRYLGVRSSDARLQRPEYLGGGKQTLQFSEVLQTGVTTSGNSLGVGDMRGHGIGALRSNRYRRYFEEHGYVFSLMVVKPKTMYLQGQHKHWRRRTREEYFQKELQHIGQQEVTISELYANTNNQETVFGYQDRYDEYRRSESGISGEFRTTLDFWHYGRIFTAAPTLNAAFVESTPTKRVNAVTSTDCLWIMANHSIQARRLVARTGASFMQ